MKKWIAKLLGMKTVVVERKRAGSLDDRKFVTGFGSGPTHPLWKSVEEMLARLEDELLDMGQDMNVPERVKLEVVAKVGALREIRAQMWANWEQSKRLED